MPVTASLLDQLGNLIMHNLCSVLRAGVGAADSATTAFNSFASNKRGQGENSSRDNSLHVRKIWS